MTNGLKLSIVFFILILFSTESLAQVYLQQLGASINGEAANDRSGVAVSNSDDGLTVAVGAYFNDGNGSNAGHVRVLEWNGSVWLQKGLDINGEAAEDWSGFSVSINATGNIVAIGAPNNDGNGSSSGHVRVYSWNGTAWIQLGTDINGEAAGDVFGGDVSLSDNGTTLAIGGSSNDGNGVDAGHVRVFTWNGTAWIQKGIDINGEAANDNSGTAVSLNQDGTVLAIGATGNDGNGANAGHVRVYSWNGSFWVQIGSDIDGSAASNFCGKSLELSNTGNRIIVGAPYFGSSLGHARVFEWTGFVWSQVGSDILGEDPNEQFGVAVSISADGTKALVGAFGNSDAGSLAGSARAFQFVASSWQQIGNDLDGLNSGDQCGTAVSISGNAQTLAVSSYLNSTSGTNAGHVRNWYLCQTVQSTDVQVACNSFTWINNQTYTSNNNTATYTYPGASSSGCDSIVTLDLTIVPSSQGIETVSSCGSYTWINGITYSTNNTTATYTFQNATASGCDSVVTLNLTVIPLAQSTNTIVSCTPITWIDGITYITSNNSASFTYPNGAISGCDSIVNLDLTINSISNINVSISGAELTAVNPNAGYVWLDCTSSFLPIPAATAQTFTASSNGNYAVELTENGCVDTSNCYAITNIGIETLQDGNIFTISPNPTNGVFKIDLGSTKDDIQITVTDINYKIISSENFKNKQTIDLDIDGPSGFYFVNISISDRKRVAKLIKY
jgi:hypothetical protein